MEADDFEESLKKLQQQLESHLAVTTVEPVTSSKNIIIEQTTTTQNRCISNLNQGHWRSPTLNHKKCAEAHEKCRQHAWVTNSCSTIKYDSYKSLKCLAGQRIQVIGDSRARQLFRSLENVLDNRKTIIDELNHNNLSRDYHLNGPNNNNNELKINWQWFPTMSSVRDYGKLYNFFYSSQTSFSNPSKMPSIIIFNSIFLHDSRACDTIEICQIRLKKFKDVIIHYLVPFMINMVREFDTKFVFVAHEDVQREGKSTYNYLRSECNNWLAKIFERLPFMVTQRTFPNDMKPVPSFGPRFNFTSKDIRSMLCESVIKL